MNKVSQILEEYDKFRRNGSDPKDAVQRIRPDVDGLSKPERDELVAQIRTYETNGQQMPTPQPAPPSPPKENLIRRLRRAEGPSDTRPTPPEMELCPTCGKPNRPGEILCVHCGHLLKNVEEQAATKQLNIEDPRTDYFGINSELFMRVRHNGQIIQLRPQQYDHELIIGRSDAKGIVSPDVDLTPHDGANRGVSRMHMSVQFKRDQDHLVVADMGSANGLFINGQKLLGSETRVLHHGDQLRLGEMLLDIAYRHS